MGRILKLTLVTYFVACVSCLQYKVVDLTHNHGKDSIYWPTHSGYERYIDHRGLYEGTDIWYVQCSFWFCSKIATWKKNIDETYLTLKSQQRNFTTCNDPVQSKV